MTQKPFEAAFMGLFKVGSTPTNQEYIRDYGVEFHCMKFA